jgi:hypothetical protein
MKEGGECRPGGDSFKLRFRRFVNINDGSRSRRCSSSPSSSCGQRVVRHAEASLAHYAGGQPPVNTLPGPPTRFSHFTPLVFDVFSVPSSPGATPSRAVVHHAEASLAHYAGGHPPVDRGLAHHGPRKMLSKYQYLDLLSEDVNWGNLGTNLYKAKL